MIRIRYTCRSDYMKKLKTSFFVFLIAFSTLHAQDTLPKFSLINAGNNRIIVGWTNNFKDIKQISIQRSFDSLTGYKSILTVPDPTTPQNGYVDSKAPNDHMFYRLYILLDKGIFLFSPAKRPFRDTSTKRVEIVKIPEPEKVADTIQVGDSFIIVKPFGVQLDKFPETDSVAVPKINNNKPVPNAFMPSLYVYTYRDGYVRVTLPADESPSKYSIKFFEENGNFLFELKDLRENDFKIDKTNFYHAGWFRFELYENGKLKEKHKFKLEKDF